MNQKHSPASHHKHDHGKKHGAAWKRAHRNWLVWVVVALMLAAMLMYVFSDDESLQPGAPPGEPVPAAAGP